MYHRVIDPENSTLPLEPGMYVRPATFRMQMDYLKTHCNVISLEQLTEKLSHNTPLPSRTVTITFDDGWRDNGLNAYPILHELGLPATVFLPTAYIGTAKLYWTDALALSLSKRLGGDKLRDELNKELSRLKQLPRAAREGEIKTFDTPEHNQRVFLDWDEIRRWSKQGIAFGSHSHCHQFLNELGMVELRNDIAQSYTILRSQLSNPSAVFCYPGGETNAMVDEVLLQSGVHYSLSVNRSSSASGKFTRLGRIGIHEDISSSLPLFIFRVWGR